jgi:hypothetical protein
MNAFNCPDYMKAEGNAFPVHVMKAYEGVRVHLYSFLTLALDCGEWSSFMPQPLYLQGK